MKAASRQTPHLLPFRGHRRPPEAGAAAFCDGQRPSRLFLGKCDGVRDFFLDANDLLCGYGELRYLKSGR